MKCPIERDKSEIVEIQRSDDDVVLRWVHLRSLANMRNWRLWLLLLQLVLINGSFGCHLFPTGVEGKHVKLNVGGNPHSYVPGTTYPVWLSSSTKFDEFFVNLDGDNGGGSFQITDNQPVAFSEDCSNTLVQKKWGIFVPSVKFLWNAPFDGCSTIKAAVKIGDTWEQTSIRFCPLANDMMTKKKKEATKCCACDYAKYKIIFEGLWSNETHPKDFPVTSQFTHFSDVIGATHSPNFTMWREGDYATYGFQQLAEYGVIRELDMELKNSSRHLRSIVKATGLWWPHVNSNTSSQFIVDPRHYLFSVASMFGPSPDWVVGVSSMNLCQEDCTWLEGKIIDLYPYDAGTDDGFSYQSPKVPTTPHERIRKITTMYPEDPRAPFYNPSSKEFPPLARLYITRDKVIPKKCSDLTEKEILEQVTVNENNEDEERAGCEVGPYSTWSPCSVTCGKGIRMRQRTYVNEKLAKQLKCDRQLISREMCVAEDDKCSGDDVEETLAPSNPSECDVTAWSDWSECTVTCGIGMKIRQRSFVSSDQLVNKKCSLISMMEKEKCMKPFCTGGRKRELPTSCATTEWSDWSTCSASCGQGVITRVRLFKDPDHGKNCHEFVPLEEKVTCSGILPSCGLTQKDATKICRLPIQPGPCRANFPRYAYNHKMRKCVEFSYGGCRGNQNNFESIEECQQTCFKAGSRDAEGPQPRHCQVSNWGPWSECSPCVKGTRKKTRTILVEPNEYGRKCPPLERVVKCMTHVDICEAMGRL